MRGKRAKQLRREAYGPRTEWTKEGYFPKHPHYRKYTVMTTYQTMVPRFILAIEDDHSGEPLATMKGPDGKMYNYRYVPFLMNGRFEADLERRKYKAFKKWWKRHGIICGRLRGY